MSDWLHRHIMFKWLGCMLLLVLFLGGCKPEDVHPTDSPTPPSTTVLKVGMDPHLGLPFIQKTMRGQQVSYGGFEVDVIQFLAHKLKRQIQIVEVPWDKLLEAVQTGQVELALNALEKPINANVYPDVRYSSHYYSSFQQLVILKQDNFTYNLSDLKSKAIGVVKNSTAEALLKELNPLKKANMDIRRFPDPSALFAALVQRKVKAALADRAVAQWYKWKYPVLKLTGDRILESPFIIAIHQSQSELLKQINQQLQQNARKPDFISIFVRWHLSSLSKVKPH